MLENKEKIAAFSSLAFLSTMAVTASADAQIKNQDSLNKVQKSNKTFDSSRMCKMYGGRSFDRDRRLCRSKPTVSNDKTSVIEKNLEVKKSDDDSTKQKDTTSENANGSKESRKLNETKNNTLKDTADPKDASKNKVIKKPKLVIKNEVEGYLDWEAAGWPRGWNTGTYVPKENEGHHVVFYGGPPIFRTKEEYEELYGKVDSNEQKSEEEVKKEDNKDLGGDAKKNNVKDSSGDETTGSKDEDSKMEDRFYECEYYGGPPIFRSREEYEELYGKVYDDEKNLEEKVKNEKSDDKNTNGKETANVDNSDGKNSNKVEKEVSFT